MATELVARRQPITELPFKYPQYALTDAYQPAPNLTVARGTVMGQVSAGVNDVDTVTLNNTPTGGTFTVTVANQQGTFTTTPLAYNAATSAVQAAIQALANIGAGNATVTGTAGSSYVVTSAGSLNAMSLGTVTASGTALTGAGAQPTATVAHTTSDIPAGTVRPYASGNTDGSQVPIGISMYDFSTDPTGNVTVIGTGTSFGLPQGRIQTVPVYICGWFRTAELVGLDNNAIALLFARQFQTSDGTGSVRIP